MEAILRHRLVDIAWLAVTLAIVTLGFTPVERHTSQTAGSINRTVAKNHHGAPSNPPKVTTEGRHK
jgi:hypothetical protein